MSRNKGHPDDREVFNNGTLKCGAKTRNGGRCQRAGTGAGNRCRKHGGASTGAPKGNQNNLKHGLHSNLLFASFTKEQLDYLDEMPMDTMTQLENEIRIITAREIMMLERMKKLEEEDYSTITIEEVEIQNGNRISNQVKKTKESNQQLIVKMQEAITKVQLQKLKMINQKAQLEAQRKTEDVVDISQVVEAITSTDVWNDTDEEE